MAGCTPSTRPAPVGNTFSTAALTGGLLEEEHSAMSILVTGCAGFIGSNVSNLLVESGHSVKGLDNLEPFASALARWRLGPVLRSDQFAYLQIDITDKERLLSVFSRTPATDPVDAVIHLAARAGVRASVEDPRSCYETNVLGTLNLLELCREFGVSRFILASTSSVYGDHEDGPVSEDALSNRPLSPYAASKSAAETLLHSYHHLHGMDAVVLRYFTVYGPAGRPDMSVFRFVRAIAEVEPVTVYGGRHPEAGLHLRGRRGPRNCRGPRPYGVPDHQPGKRPADLGEQPHRDHRACHRTVRSDSTSGPARGRSLVDVGGHRTRPRSSGMEPGSAHQGGHPPLPCPGTWRTGSGPRTLYEHPHGSIQREATATTGGYRNLE